MHFLQKLLFSKSSQWFTYSNLFITINVSGMVKHELRVVSCEL